MKTMKMLALLFLVLGLSGCMNDSPKSISTKDDAFKTMTAEEIIKSGASINVTVAQLEDMEREAVSRSGGEERPLWAIPAYRAAHYRFVTHAKQDENGIMTWSAKCGSDLNMSDDLFNAFVREFESVNGWIQESLERGEKCEPIWINEEYLNNVLVDELIEKRLKHHQELQERIKRGEINFIN